MVDDPAALTATIFGAIERTGVRALVSAGWSEIGGDNIPDNVFLLGETRTSPQLASVTPIDGSNCLNQTGRKRPT